MTPSFCLDIFPYHYAEKNVKESLYFLFLYQIISISLANYNFFLLLLFYYKTKHQLNKQTCLPFGNFLLQLAFDICVHWIKANLVGLICFTLSCHVCFGFLKNIQFSEFTRIIIKTNKQNTNVTKFLPPVLSLFLMTTDHRVYGDLHFHPAVLWPDFLKLLNLLSSMH